MRSLMLTTQQPTTRLLLLALLDQGVIAPDALEVPLPCAVPRHGGVVPLPVTLRPLQACAGVHVHVWEEIG